MFHFKWATTSRTPGSPSSSVDEEDFNGRVYPDWQHYRPLMTHRGYRLDTVRDVRLYYEQYWASLAQQPSQAKFRSTCKGYPRSEEADDDLCRDRGLPDNLFRGSQLRDGKRIVIKAVNARSRELETIRCLSSAILKTDPRNHTIPVLDIILVPDDGMAFIIQEEWSSSFAHCAPSTPRAFIQAMRQCLEGVHFMHSHNIAHLDISCTNILTNCGGAYAYIDFELSRHFSAGDKSVVRGIRGTELPPEIERGEESSPFKVDIWALGQTILRAYKASGLDIPGIMTFIQPMIHEIHSARPSARTILNQLDRMIFEDRLYKRRTGAPIN